MGEAAEVVEEGGREKLDEKFDEALKSGSLPGAPVAEDLQALQVEQFIESLGEIELLPQIKSLMRYLRKTGSYLKAVGPLEYQDARKDSGHAGMEKSRTFCQLILTPKGFRIMHQTHKRSSYYRDGGPNPFHADYAFKTKSSTGIYYFHTERRVLPFAEVATGDKIKDWLLSVVDSILEGGTPSRELRSRADIRNDIRPYDIASDFVRTVKAWDLQQGRTPKIQEFGESARDRGDVHVIGRGGGTTTIN